MAARAAQLEAFPAQQQQARPSRAPPERLPCRPRLLRARRRPDALRARDCDGEVQVSAAPEADALQYVAWPPQGPPSPFIDSWSELEPPDEPDRVRAKNRPGRKKSEDHKRKIREAMKGRGQGEKKSAEHREKIRQSMLRRMNMDSTLRLRISSSSKGKPKVCSLCGEAGHNRRTCPLNETARREISSAVSSSSSSSAAAATRKRPESGVRGQQERPGPSSGAAGRSRSAKRCSICGKAGHNRATCPDRSPATAASRRQKARKQQVCSLCGQAGHNARTCPARSVKQQLNLPDEPVMPPKEPPPADAATQPAGDDSRSSEARGAAPSGPEDSPASSATQILPLPLKKRHMCQAAVMAASAAFRDGHRYQRIELSLQRSAQQGLDMESWPGGIREQFGVALPLAELVLSGLKQEERFTGRMSAEVLDDADAVGCWQNDKLAAVLFPTADTLGRVRELCQRKDSRRMVLLINPQWQGEGQVISDFGVGKSRYDAEEFVENFRPTFCLRSLRLLGQNISLYRCYPGLWQVHIVNRLGQAECLGTELTEPSYRRIEELVRRHLDRNTSWLDRVRLGNLWRR